MSDKRFPQTGQASPAALPSGDLSTDNARVLTINAGSSSIRFSVFRVARPPVRELSGRIERIGLPDAAISVTREGGPDVPRRTIQAVDHAACLEPLIRLLEQEADLATLIAVGHRVVHGGMRYDRPQRLTPEVLAEMRRLGPYNPGHFPAQIGLIEAFGRRFPSLPQVACFDTAFHRTVPRVARLLPLPRRYDAAGVRRYGFHGLSYAWLMRELARLGRPGEAGGRVILAHLGNGSSMAAVRGGRSIDTTMGFTPTAGLMMSTRTGDLDPGVFAYLARTEGMTVERFQRMINAESGLLGVSETSSDMRDLLAREAHDVRAAEAVALFCYDARKWIGALSAVLEGLDTLVFSGGIGENAPEIRSRICAGLEFLGVRLDETRNAAGAAVISAADAAVTVRVIRTDEEAEIARGVCDMLQEL